MRKQQLLQIATVPIHNSTQHRKVIEFLLEESPNATKIKHRIRVKERKEFISKFGEKMPLAVAAAATKKEVKEYIKSLHVGREERRAIKRYFLRARVVVNGNKQHPKRKRRFTYNEYIHSSVWENRKSAYYRKNGKRCAACGITTKIQLHHTVYTKFDGTEPDVNLTPLCELHHAQYHDKYGSGRNMKETTYEFVENVRAGNMIY